MVLDKLLTTRSFVGASSHNRHANTHGVYAIRGVANAETTSRFLGKAVRVAFNRRTRKSGEGRSCMGYGDEDSRLYEFSLLHIGRRCSQLHPAYLRIETSDD